MATFEVEPTNVHRLFDCPNPVTYCDGSAAYCACKPPLDSVLKRSSELAEPDLDTEKQRKVD